ncbi:PTS sugar transporter subunit IIC [Lactobacillus sp. ESL0791]|uniref:PTS mannose/fructose/sorbose/N-acetylgalactosamine transporter subunit IIC n=1 Tax=Lactobacillus sp. ESL0791 TaxID=2983234 RepID=UPI0023F8C81F|nr:PTS sugar transporter subunit IIC [Lactobacillus sp. ESL0791]MDF7639238.1 PTS sugar transporter subunit IIC [Lactobacillus sp. ESL0791]
MLLRNILIIIYGFIINFDKEGPKLGISQPVVAGLIAGLIMGDVKTGLYIGGTLQLMTLGITSFGGASVPDYQTAALIGTYLTIATHQSAAIGIALAIPIALLIVQVDVLKWSANIFCQQRAEKYANQGNYRMINWMQYLATLFTSFVSGIPVLLTVVLGPKIVGSFINYIPAWLSGGLKTAAGILPAVGIGMLLQYLPTRDYFSYIIIGFVLAIYLKMPIVGISLVGLAIALILYKNQTKGNNANQETVTGGSDEDE